MTPETLLDALRAAGVIDELDAAFARLVLGLAGEAATAELAWGAALASQRVAEGHVCCVLEDEAERVLAPSLPPTPTAATWTAILRASPVVAAEDPDTVPRPLVLDGAGRLYLHRYWRYEQRLAEELERRAAATCDDVDLRRLAADLQAVFPTASDAAGEPDWQRVAAATAVLRRLAVISGGPGTGKTFTVTVVLALLAAQASAAGRPFRAALVAPTGKAAARMQEAVRDARDHLAAVLGPAVVAELPSTASTVHRLLGLGPDRVGYRRRGGEPMPLDVVVLDEASMVDLALMTKLVAQLPSRARLVLVGDRDQLASVEAGAVLGDVCGPAPGPSATFASRLAEVLGQGIPAAADGVPPLADAVVVLRRSRRFGEASGIGRLAAAVNAGDAAAALVVLGAADDVALVPAAGLAELRERLERTVVPSLAPYFAALGRWDPGGDVAAQVECLFAALARFRVVCAHRHGSSGAERLAEEIERLLAARGIVPQLATWYPGRPILVTRNDHALGVFNGDVGITLPDRDGRLRVAFLGADRSVRMLAPARLPPFEAYWATTVHRAQGSEFDEVAVVLPPEPSRVTTRELLYTAVTRARRRIEIWGTPALVETTIARTLRRSSGLRDRLWGPRRPSPLPSPARHE